MEYNYTCPSCSHQLAVPESLIGQNLACPNCKKQFFATPPESPPTPAAQGPQAEFAPPARLPFFKSARKAILEQRLQELLSINGGVVTKDTRHELQRNATVLGLHEITATELLKEHFMNELAPIKERMQSLSTMTDHDYYDIQQLREKYNQDCYDLQELKQQYNGDLVLAEREQTSLDILETDALKFNLTKSIESTGRLPPAIKTDLMLNDYELAFNATPSAWAETRMHSHGYVGASISLPTGIKHVRFRFGGYVPIRSEELTELSKGMLYVTSERLLFMGDSRNTTISLNKIIDGHIFDNALRIEKSTGKPDYFSMKPIDAKYVLTLIGLLK